MRKAGGGEGGCARNINLGRLKVVVQAIESNAKLKVNKFVNCGKKVL